MVDGIWEGQFWAANGVPNWVEVDFESDYEINKFFCYRYENLLRSAYLQLVAKQISSVCA